MRNIDTTVITPLHSIEYLNSQNNISHTRFLLYHWKKSLYRKKSSPTLGVSGLLKGEGSAEQFSLSNESSLCLCANFLFSASAIRAAGSDEHATPLLLRLLTGVPPGDLQIQIHTQYWTSNAAVLKVWACKIHTSAQNAVWLDSGLWASLTWRAWQAL